MLAYIVRRLLLILPTLLGIMLINFVIIQAAPGGPVDQLIAELRGRATTATERAGGGSSGGEVSGGSGQQQGASAGTSQSRAERGIDPKLIAKLKKEFGLDKPLYQQFLLMMGKYVTFDFGQSFFKGQPVMTLVAEAMPVSISIGLWTTLLTYLICIPLGIAKAVRDGTRFDAWTSGMIIVGNAVPGFLFAILLIVVFAGGRYLDWFPLRGLVSDNWHDLSFFAKIGDYFWHMTLPITALVIGGFASLTMLTKNSFLDEINKQYVLTARAKGLAEKRVLYGHIFRNAMLLVIAGFPGAFVTIFFSGALLIEVIFSLQGLGLLGFQAVFTRDYPIIFATLYVFSLLGLIVKLITDLTYIFVDPRIDFESREV
jgi:microcin C transport system permease protein